MSGIGHNGGPTMEAGYGFRKVAWKKARASLLPTLPLEIVRVRVARAKRLGLPYRTYATIRATSGHGTSWPSCSRATRWGSPRRRAMPEAVRALRLDALGGAAERLAAVYAPLRPRRCCAVRPASTRRWRRRRS
jgi:hypothetical protein